jgi:hypothetical protein
MGLSDLVNRAKEIVQRRGGTESLKQDAEELKDIARSEGSAGDKLKKGAEALKEPGAKGAEDRPGGPTPPGGAEDRPGGPTPPGGAEDRPGGPTQPGGAGDRPGGPTQPGGAEQDRPGGA